MAFFFIKFSAEDKLLKNIQNKMPEHFFAQHFLGMFQLFCFSLTGFAVTFLP